MTFYVILGAVVAFLIRLELVSRMYDKALKATSAECGRRILTGIGDAWEPWLQYQACDRFVVHMIDLRKWTFGQFFPHLRDHA
jgi:hypothetical protein